MSEKLHGAHESLPENVEASAESKENLERLKAAAEQAEHEHSKVEVESLSQSAETQAVSGKEFNIGDKVKENPKHPYGIDKSMKADAYTRSLRKIRSNLNAPERTFSKVVHAKPVEAVSNVTAKTVARPSSFLGGAVGALLGSSFLLYMSRQYGFTYNYTVFFVLFAGGFAVGLVLELLLRLVFRRRHSRS